MSFLKQLPPKPGPGLRNLLPILVSVPIACATSLIFAPVDSQRAEIEFIDEILWAKKALATNFDNSELHKFVVIIFDGSTQLRYISDIESIEYSSSPPIRTLSGFCRSSIAVPSARNSGFETIEKVFLVYHLDFFYIPLQMNLVLFW